MATASPSNPGVAHAPQPHDASAGRASRLHWLASHGAVNLLVFGLLAGLFLLGHSTGWKLPSRASLFGGSAATPEDWCDEHLVPASICVECLPGQQKPKGFGFCREHGVAECVLCHPELAQVQGEPTLPTYDSRAALALVPRPVNNSRNMLHERRVQFANAAAADKAGIQVDVVSAQTMSDVVTANGEIQFDPTRVAHLSSRAGGTVVHVFKITGDEVQPGDVLAIVDVSAVGQAKSDLLQAIVERRLRESNYARLKAAGIGVAGVTLTEGKAALEEAEVALISARQALVNLGLEVPEAFDESDPNKIADQLRFLGIPQAALKALPAETRSANLYAVRTPFAGAVVASDSVVGEVVTAEDVLYTVADPRHMWLTLAVPQEDAPYVKRGLRVDFITDDGALKTGGNISWVSPTVDERTRTLQARVVLENPESKLRDKTFGAGRILLREEPQAVVVPRAAVQSTGDATFVFVRDKNYLKKDTSKLFYPRQVRLGASDADHVELLAGVLPGEVVATEGSNVILSQLLRSNLGAGCGCHEFTPKK